MGTFVRVVLVGWTFPFLLVSAGLAFVAGLPLLSMVEQADFIVIGKVIRIETAGKMRSGKSLEGHKSVVEIEEALKGDPEGKTIEVYYSHIADDANFKIGEKD